MANKIDLFLVQNSKSDVKRQEQAKLHWIELAMKNYGAIQKNTQPKHSSKLSDIL